MFNAAENKAKVSKHHGTQGVPFQLGGKHQPTVQVQNKAPPKTARIDHWVPTPPKPNKKVKPKPAADIHCVSRRANR